MSSAWTKFRNLCDYYIDCVKYSEKRQEYLFTNQLNETFILPALEVNWHLKEATEIETSKIQRFARKVLLTADETDELFIGYPLSSFISPNGVHCLCPIMLFPVSVTTLGEGRESGLKITIDRQGIDINKDWVEYHVPRDRQQYFIRACERTDDVMGCVDVENALQFISNHFNVSMDPNFMDFTVRHSEADNELLNSAALFIGGKTKYTRNLIRELHQIKNEPDAVLDTTALAYVFRDPPLLIPEVQQKEKRIPAVFTGEPLNAKQYNAVEQSLNSPVCKVTGPPGTGKSHMSVNLIANEVFNGGSVLFTCKNHKAIHAVFEMCQACKPHSDFDLVEFCTVPGSDVSSQWDKLQDRLETVKGIVIERLGKYGDIEVPDEILFPSISKVEEALDVYREVEHDLERYENLRARLSLLEKLMIEVEETLVRVPQCERDSEEFAKLLQLGLDAIEQEPRLSFISRIKRRVSYLLGKGEETQDVRNQLNSLVPGIAPAVLGKSSISRNVRRLLKSLKFRKLVMCWKLGAYDAVQQDSSASNYSELVSILKTAFKSIGTSLREAYIEKYCVRVRDVDENELISKIKGALQETPIFTLPFLTSIQNFTKYEKSLSLFRELLKAFPAWAVTLLSLRKASPCLPGVFSLVIIDEASQCEIPPMIPALFRAQRVAVVGDPDQFPPVITMKEKRNDALRKKYEILNAEMNKYSFCENNVFSVISAGCKSTIKLVEHFRCMDEIAMYFNEEFYRGGLCPCVGDRSDQGYNNYNLKPGMSWVDAVGGDDVEISAAIDYLKKMKKSGFKGSVGVISPLRKLANKMKTLCFEQRKEMPEGLTDDRVNTANGFQGGQCDIVLFLLGLNKDRTPGRDGWYITSDENKYIYNVSVSRAKVCFVTFGDRERVMQSGISRIIKLIPDQRKPIHVKVGPGEKILEKALKSVGLNPIAQYPLLGRYLDLALVAEKIDIEVDGQAWHLDRNGCRKADDIHRDLLMEINEWRVIRFWHHEVINDAHGCAKKVLEILKERVA